MKILSRFLLSLLVIVPFVSFVHAEETWQWTVPTEGTANVAEDEIQIPTSVIINEMLPYPLANEDEYIELYNYGEEYVSLQGWTLKDKSSVVHSFSEKDGIEAKSYLVLRGNFSLNNTSDEEVTLISPDKQIQDTFAYTTSLVERNVSLNRECDVYELRFCEVMQGNQTPGAVNAKKTLQVSTSIPSGTVEKGTKVALTASMKDAKIYYSFTPEAPMTDMLEYKGPIVIDRTTSLFFFAIANGVSSPVEKMEYRLEAKPESSLWLNEIYISPTATWVEVYNASANTLSLNDVYLSTGTSSDVQEFGFPQNAVIYSGRFYVLELPVDTISAKSKISLKYKDAVVGETVMPAQMQTATSWILTRFVEELNNTSFAVAAEYMVTDMPTKNGPNVIATIHSDDADADLLTELEEKTIGTDPTRFDSNKNALPDFYDKGKELLEESHQFLYRALLSRLLFFEYTWDSNEIIISGKALPLSRISMVSAGKPYETRSDKAGKFTFTIPGNDTVAYLSFYLIDQNDVSSFNIGPFTVEKNAISGLRSGDVKIVRALPNPEGTDAKESEWIELQNMTQQSVKFVPTIKIGNTTKKLSAVTLEPGVPYRLHGTDIGISITNSTTIQLLSGTVLLDQITYSNAKEGEILEFLSPVKQTASASVRSSAKSTSGVATVKKINASVTSVPSLKEVHSSVIASLSTFIHQLPEVPRESTHVPVPEKAFAIGLFLMMLSTSIGSFIWKW